MCKNNRRTIKLKEKIDSTNDVLTYYNDVFEKSIKDVIRYFSIYDMNSKNNKNSNIVFDYYNLTLLSLRKLFEKKMKSKIRLKTNELYKTPNVSYQLNFIQWINCFYKIFNEKEINNHVFKNNIKDKIREVKELKAVLQEFEKIYNDDEIINDYPNATHPLKTRIYNYASKYVAHRIPRSMIEKWDYNNEVFPSYEEIKDLVCLISRIEDKYYNFYYYWANANEMPYYDYSLTLEQKSNRYYNEFVNDIKIRNKL